MNKTILKNTQWNYFRILVRMVTGVFTFRMLFQYLPDNSFGFWAFLWSILAWSVLMDLGMALTVQKQVATAVVDKDWRKMNQVIASAFWIYCAIGCALVLIGWLIAHPFLSSMNVELADRGEFWKVFMIFVAGMAINFPAGIFPEILRGMQKLDLQNRSVIVGSVLNLGFVWWGTHHNWSFSSIMLAAVATLLGPNIWLIVVCKQQLPELNLGLRYLSRENLKPILSFSFQAYLILLTYTLMTKTDQFFIGSILSLSAIAVYQPGAKLAEIFGALSRQLADALQPAAASLYAKGDPKAIQSLLLSGMRISVLLAAPMYLMFAAYTETVIGWITGLKSIPESSFWTAQILCLWAFSLLITHNVFKRIAVMCGHERLLTRLGIIECILNLVLTIVLLKIWKRVEGAALATLISTWFVGWGVLWRLAAREAGVSVWQLTHHVLVRNLFGVLPMIIYVITTHFLWPNRQEWVIWYSGLDMIFAMLAGGIGIYFFALSPEERIKIDKRFGRTTTSPT
jgi:O-antigen/teichoic acid export membrane protein